MVFIFDVWSQVLANKDDHKSVDAQFAFTGVIPAGYLAYIVDWIAVYIALPSPERLHERTNVYGGQIIKSYVLTERWVLVGWLY